MYVERYLDEVGFDIIDYLIILIYWEDIISMIFFGLII